MKGFRPFDVISETANFIDMDDERWKYFLVFEKYNRTELSSLRL